MAFSMSKLTQRTAKQRMQALQILLKQVRAAGDVWSDGQTIMTGEDLKRFKSDICDRIIKNRVASGMKTYERMQRPKDDLPWRNAVNIRGLYAKSDTHNGLKARTLKEDLTAWALSNPQDSGSTDRRRVAIRALRRHFPNDAKDIGQTRLAVSKQEASFIEEAIGKKTWITKSDLEVQNGRTVITIPKDQIVQYSARRGFHIELSDGIQLIDECFVKRARLRDLTRIMGKDATTSNDMDFGY